MNTNAFGKAIANNNLEQAAQIFFERTGEFRPQPLHQQGEKFNLELEISNCLSGEDLSRINNQLVENPGCPKIDLDWGKNSVLEDMIPVYAAALYKCEVTDVEIVKVAMMISGKSPLEIELKIRNAKEVMYLKPCIFVDDPRPLGLALINRVKPPNVKYDFVFDAHVTAEREVKGIIANQLPQELGDQYETFIASANFIEGYTYFKATTLLIALADMHDHNYVIRRDGTHIPIDFDRMEPCSRSQIKQFISDVVQKVGIDYWKDAVSEIRMLININTAITQIGQMMGLVLKGRYAPLGLYLQNADLRNEILDFESDFYTGI